MIEPRLLPNLSILRDLVLQAPSGRVRFSVEAKKIITPLMESNGFNIENVVSAQQYKQLQKTAENRVAEKLLELRASLERSRINVDDNINPIDPIDVVYFEIKEVERRRFQVKDQIALRGLENRSSRRSDEIGE